MKKTIVIIATLAVALGASAQKMDPSLSGAQKEFRKTHQARVPLKKEGMTIAPQTKILPQNTTASSLPEDRWFPGEWEEVQAITVTWPYWTVPGNWQELGNQLSYYSATASFSGYGDIYKYVNGNWVNQGFGEIDQLPLCVGYTIDATDAEEMAYTSVFAYLIDAIRVGGAEPWVRVTHLSDSVYIQQHMAYLGLATNGIKWIEGFGDSFWFRDCGPICFYYGEGDTVGMLDFEYYSGRAIDDSLPQLLNLQKGLPIWTTSIKWEGGNCIVDGDGLVMSSDEIYSTNADRYGQILWAGPTTSPTSYEQKTPLTQQQVRDSLAYLLGPRGVKILPKFRYDGGTGHVDLYADMYDENAFVFSQMPSAYSNWTDYRTGNKNMDSICSWTSTFGNNFKKTYIPFPKKDNGSDFASQSEYNQRYTRTYSNHTFVNNVIIQPCFSKVVDGEPSAGWDHAYFELIKKAYPGYTLYPIDVRSFDGSGGAIHCITKQIPAERPIRILHPSITGNTEQTYVSTEAPIEAIISNVDGISEAKVVYRVDGGEWQEKRMWEDGRKAQGSRYETTLPTPTMLTNGGATVDYYISATSNAGKTITKPYPASQGGYYTFTLGNHHIGIADVENLEENFGQFYPNPAADEAHMIITLGEREKYEVNIVDQSGRTIHTSSLEADGEIIYTIYAGRLATGIYNVVFSNGKGRVVRRLIVK